ncbi:MAG: FAD-binding oxidoreductase [Pseudomonadota bacterium]
MSAATFDSWGRVRRADRNAQTFSKTLANQLLKKQQGGLLPFGNGRSYGDSCHNDVGALIDMREQSSIHALDEYSGVLTADAGVMLHEIIAHVLPKGWFLPVTPGTQLVTLGGAIANDVHGKNHHRRGTFGNHIEGFELLRSDKGTLWCSPEQNSDLFHATIGGLGLTGIITRAQLKLMPVQTADIEQKTVRLNRLSDFFEHIEDADAENEYCVAWIDSLSRGSKMGRGHLLLGNHAKVGSRAPMSPKARLSVPFTPPFAMINSLSLKAFNFAYFNKLREAERTDRVGYSSYFYPLDGVGNWNRLYGPHGLFQHQSVVPFENGEAIVAKLIEASQKAGQGSFLTVLKRFGEVPSPGLLSFPKPGFTLTLDFANSGPATLKLLDRLDELTLSAGGRVNPYKDARMAASTFQTGFPNWRELEALRDPAMMSDFWRRVTG